MYVVSWICYAITLTTCAHTLNNCMLIERSCMRMGKFTGWCKDAGPVAVADPSRERTPIRSDPMVYCRRIESSWLCHWRWTKKQTKAFQPQLIFGGFYDRVYFLIELCAWTRVAAVNVKVKVVSGVILQMLRAQWSDIWFWVQRVLYTEEILSK